MPSSLHQGAARLLADDPELAFELLREIHGLELPELVDVRERRGVIDRFVPCFGDSGELRPDLVLFGDSPEHPSAGVGLIIEPQRKVDPLKRWRLWVYWALVAEQLGAPTVVMVLALSDPVSRWARGLGQLEYPPREALLVLDRHNMPVVPDLATARRQPARAVLAALIHGSHGDLRSVELGLKVTRELEDERRWRYASYILASIPEHHRDIIMGALDMPRHELSEIERNSIAFHDGLDEGREEGRQEGREEGRRLGLIELVLTILELRSVPVDQAARRRIEGCSSRAQLERWRERAKQVDEVGALFER